MKKHVLMLAFALTFCTGAVMAQGLSLGVKGGLNFANQKFDADGFSVSPDGRTSFHLGLFAVIGAGPIGVQPEVIYNSVGSKVDLGSFGEATTKLNYLTIPVMVRFNFAKIVNIHAGPNFGLLLSAKAEDDDGSEDVKDAYKGMDLGLGVGIGLDLPAGLIASARYNLGLSNIAEDADGSDFTVKNNVFQLSVGYKFIK